MVAVAIESAFRKRFQFVRTGARQLYVAASFGMHPQRRTQETTC